MNFISAQFALFGLTTLFLYWTLKDRFKVPILLISSYIFYCFWDWRFTALLFFLTFSNYFLARKMYNLDSIRAKKYFLIFCLSQNLLVLFVFKYFNFFTEGAERLFSFAGLKFDFPTAQILLPLGLSFFIFQTSSYISIM